MATGVGWLWIIVILINPKLTLKDAFFSVSLMLKYKTMA